MKMYGGITSPSLITTSKTIIWTGCLVFINIGTSCGNSASRRLFCEFTIWSRQKCPRPERARTCSVGGDAWICAIALQCFLFSSPSWPLIKKIGPFSSCMRNTGYGFMHDQPDKKLRPSHIHSNGLDWLAGIIVHHALDPINKFGSSFLIRTIDVRLTISPTFEFNLGLIAVAPRFTLACRGSTW